jgi:GGDEF domain-containing protein
MADIRRASKKLKLPDGFSVSAGIEICKKEKNDFMAVHTKADKALYYAKQQGGGKYYFHDRESDYESGSGYSVDLKKLVALVQSKDVDTLGDDFHVNYPDIRNVYDFVKIQVERYNQNVQLLLFNLRPVDEMRMDLDERDRIMGLLEKAISVSVGGVDVCARYSSTQRIVILVEHTKEEVDAVIERIMKEFYKMYDKKEVSISYDVANLEVTIHG